MSDALPALIDVVHDGLPGSIGAYLLPETADRGPGLVDPGPSPSIERLRAGLEQHGVRVSDLRFLLLTHVHLDHAGASGHLARENPHLQIHIHHDAVRYLEDPARLVASTRRTFGDAHDRLWGEVLPIQRSRFHGWSEGSDTLPPGIRGVPSPGHIAHHLSFLDTESGVLYAGDSLGIVLSPRSPTHPATPPPAVSLTDWYETLSRYGELDPTAAAVTHFGFVFDFHRRRSELFGSLRALEARVRESLLAEEVGAAERYDQVVRREQARFLPRDRVDRYFDTFRASTDWAGVERDVRTSA